MKQLSTGRTLFKKIVACVTCASFLLLVSSEGLCRKKNKCGHDGEVIIETTPAIKPDWVTNKVHFTKGRYDYFIGISTQNRRPEDGKHMAILEAKTSFMQHMGELIQQKEQGVMTLTETDWQNLWGSLKAPTLISEMQLEEWYFEKVAAYKNCRPKYHYDVYALIKMPKEAVTIEKQKALEYLKGIQKTESARSQSPLIPKVEFPSRGNKYAKAMERPPSVSSHSSYDMQEPQYHPRAGGMSAHSKSVLIKALVTIAILAGLSVGTYYIYDHYSNKKNSAPGGGGGNTGDIYISGPMP